MQWLDAWKCKWLTIADHFGKKNCGWSLHFFKSESSCESSSRKVNVYKLVSLFNSSRRQFPYFLLLALPSSFKRLLWLNLDNNHIREVTPHSLSPTIHTLSISHNQIRSFPVDAVEALSSLTWFKLRGNYIETIPEQSFRLVLLIQSANWNVQHWLWHVITQSLFNLSSHAVCQ